MSVLIQFFKAHHGDAIYIRANSGLESTRILIDGGPAYTFKHRERGRKSGKSMTIKFKLLLIGHKWTLINHSVS